MDDLIERLEEARRDGLAKIAEASDLLALEEARVRVLGRKSSLSAARQGLKDVPQDQRKEVGKRANEISAEIEQALVTRREIFTAAETKARWERERIDVTLPGAPVPVGSLHLLTQVLWQIIDIFTGLGYKVAEGPDVEYSRLNFDALNTPYEHPSRSPVDTFYIEGQGEEVCLRSQTSPIQIRAMEASEPPVYVVCPGRVYRRDTVDATHTNQFFQMEGLAVDNDLTMADL
ncbi:MAG: hypothetical protein H0U53_01655 [Actinobacteria bacterium]|nr:hypothetical protein [Actinomycetota bacterium]